MLAKTSGNDPNVVSTDFPKTAMQWFYDSENSHITTQIVEKEVKIVDTIDHNIIDPPPIPLATVATETTMSTLVPEVYDFVQTKNEGYFEDGVEDPVTNVLSVFANPLKTGAEVYIGLKTVLGSEN